MNSEIMSTAFLWETEIKICGTRFHLGRDRPQNVLMP